MAKRKEQPMANGNGFPTDAHEQRLLRLEGEMAEARVAQAENSAALRHLTTEVQSGNQRLSDKIDTTLAPLVEKVRDNANHLEALGERISDHSRFIEHASEAKKTAEARKSSWKKAILAILTGGGAIGAKEIVVYLFHIFK